MLSLSRQTVLSRSFTCDGSFSDELVGVVFKVNWCRKIFISSKFSFRCFPKSSPIQGLYLRHPLFNNHAICQSNQEIVNVESNNSTQLTITAETTPQALFGQHGFPSNPRKFLCDVQAPRTACRSDFLKRFQQTLISSSFPAASKNKYQTSGASLIVNSWQDS